MIAAVIANANRDPKKTPEPFKPENFMLTKSPFAEIQEPEAPMSGEEFITRFKLLTGGLGGKGNRKRTD